MLRRAMVCRAHVLSWPGVARRRAPRLVRLYHVDVRALLRVVQERRLSCSCARTDRTAEGRADGRQHGLHLGPDTHRPASCTSDVAHMHARGVFRTCARELRLRVRCKGAIVEYSQIEFAE